MSSTLAAAKAKYLQNMHDAMKVAKENLYPHLRVDFQLVAWSNRTEAALWENTAFDWAKIAKQNKDPSKLVFGIWCTENYLAAVVALRVTGESVYVDYLEANPFNACPLKGRRALIALEVATNYAQIRGRRFIMVEPKNDNLCKLYETMYGFTHYIDTNNPKLKLYRKGV